MDADFIDRRDTANCRIREIAPEQARGTGDSQVKFDHSDAGLREEAVLSLMARPELSKGAR